MGLYATTSSISELLPNFLRGNTTTSDTAGVNLFSRHIDRAEGVVNSYIRARYSLPFITATTTTNVPPIIRTLTEDITCWYTARASYAQDSQLRQEYLDTFKGAMETLGEIRDGELKLAQTAGTAATVLSANRMLSSTEGYQSTFDMDKPSAWEVDPDYLDTEVNRG